MNNRLLIVTHGRYGQTLLDVAKNIIGGSFDDCVSVISNEKLSTAELAEKISGKIYGDPESHFIIATDFPGGSCFIASKKISSSSKNVTAVSGLNISMVLSFLTKKGLYEGTPLTEIMKTDGKRAIVV